MIFCRCVRFRSSHPRFSVRKGVIRNLVKFTGKHLCQSVFIKNNFIKKETLVQVFSFEFCEISKNTWWLNLFYTSLFSIKVIFERVVTSIFYIICYISVFNIAKECLFCFSNMSNAVVPLLFICFSISLLVFLNVSLFVRRGRFMISLVIVLLMKGAWFALTDLFFFKGTFFFRVTSLVFF